MIADLFKHPRALVLSLLMHLAVIALMVLNLTFADKPMHTRAGQEVKTVQAEMVDLKQVEKQKKEKELAAKRKAEEEKKKKQLEAKKRADKKKREAEQKRKKEDAKKAELKKKSQAEEKRKKEAARKQEEKRVADAKRKADEKRKADAKRKADEKRKVEEKRVADEKRKVEEARIAEEKRKAEEARIAEEKRKAEEARIAEEKRKVEEARRQAEEQRRRAEEELKARMVAEERQQKLNSLRVVYINAIRQRIERNWNQPQENVKMPQCEVLIEQGPGGIILKVDIGACDGGTSTYRTSIENAVWRSDPLPSPADPELFERRLKLEFKPNTQ